MGCRPLVNFTRSIIAQIKYIKLEKLAPADDNVRFDIDQEQLDELTESIRLLGILEPLLVKKHNNSYKIVCGNIRYMAAKKVGLDSAPCIPIQGTDQELTVIQFHENIKRLPMSHMDQAKTFLFMREKYSLTEAQISKVVSKSVPYISQHLTILHSGDAILAALNKNSITFSVARELSHIPDDSTRENYLDYAVENGASLATIQTWVKELKKKPPENGSAAVPQNPTLDHTAADPPSCDCEVCKTATRTSQIHFVRICPRCHIAITEAISQEKDSIPE